mmetsp:Transcript_18253/g.33067  ORF Transcript_18253/g.33067 Transcript_18253/m.33067 type:complete len:263 (-) Transcript_18253:74-862(-)
MVVFASCRVSEVPSVMTTVAVCFLLLRWLLPEGLVSSNLGALTSSLVPVFSWMAFMVAPFGPMMMPMREASMVTLREAPLVAAALAKPGAACCFGNFFFLLFLGIVSQPSSSTMRDWNGVRTAGAGTGGAGVGAGAGVVFAFLLLLPLFAVFTADPFFLLFFGFFFSATVTGAGSAHDSSSGDDSTGSGVGAAAVFFDGAAFFFLLFFLFLAAPPLDEAVVVSVAAFAVVVCSVAVLVLFLDPLTKYKAIATPTPMAARCVA